LEGDNWEDWQQAMEEEINLLMKRKTWTLVDLLFRRKEVLKRKYNTDLSFLCTRVKQTCKRTLTLTPYLRNDLLCHVYLASHSWSDSISVNVNGVQLLEWSVIRLSDLYSDCASYIL
jgi:hypothetical protein